MTNDNSMLAHLAWMFVTQRENLAVEALGYILNDSASRDALVSLLRQGEAELRETQEFSTQVIHEDLTRPDLVGFDADGQRHVIIEAKFRAGLTDRQPAAYLELLPQDRPSVLLFLAPAYRFDSLWPALLNRAKRFGIQTIAEQDDVWCAQLDGGNRHMMLTSWSTLLDSVEAVIDPQGILAEDLRQLRGLCKQEENGGPQLTGNMNSQSGINALKRGLIGEATAYGEKEGFLSTDGLGWGRDGRYIKLPNVANGGVAKFGWDFSRATGERPTPLWLFFVPNGPNDMKPAEVSRRLLGEVKEEHSVPIYLPVGMEYDVVLNAVKARLRYVAALLQGNATL